MSHYQECPCPSSNAIVQHNQVLPAYSSPHAYFPHPAVYSSSSSGGGIGSNDAPQHLPHPYSPGEANGIGGSHIAGIVSAVCSMIIMVVVAVIGFLKKYVYGQGCGTGGNSSENEGLKGNNSSVKSGDSLDKNLMLMESMSAEAFPSGKLASRSATFIV